MSGPASMNEAPGGREPRRWRWARRAALGALAALAIFFVSAGLVLRHLEAPWLKRRVQSLVLASTGLELDYASARVRPLSGLEVLNLSVSSPAEFREIAHRLVYVGRLEVGWSLASLFGSGAKLERVTVDDVTVTIVEDENGRTSLDAFTRGKEQAPGPPEKSHAWPLTTPPPFDRLDLSAIELTLIRSRNGQAFDRLALRSLALHAQTQRTVRTWRLDAQAGTPAAPLSLLLVRDGGASGGGFARLELWLTGEAGPSSAAAMVDLRVREHSLAPQVSIQELFHLEARATLDTARSTTEISVAQVRAADGAAKLEAQLSLPDKPAGPLVIRQASGTIDLERLLGAAPQGLLPFTGKGALSWHAHGIEFDRAPRLLEDGDATADAHLEDVRLKLADGELAVGSGRCSVRARRGTAGPVAETSLGLSGLRLSSPYLQLGAADLDLQVDASLASDGTWTAEARTGLGSLEMSGPNVILARSVSASVKASHLRFADAQPLSVAGDVEVAGEAATFHFRGPVIVAEASGLRFIVRGPFAHSVPLAADVALEAQRLRLSGSDSRLFVNAPAQFTVRLSDTVLDLERPAASRGSVRAVGKLGPLEASLDATRQADAVDFSLSARGKNLPFGHLLTLSGRGKDIPFSHLLPPRSDPTREEKDELALALSASGRVEALSSPQPFIRQHAELHLEGPGLQRISARRLSLSVRSSGNLSRHRLDADLRLDPVDVRGTWHFALAAEVDRLVPSLSFRLASDGGPSAGLTGLVKFDRARRLLHCDFDGKLTHLAPLRPLLQRFPGANRLHLSQLELAVSAHGTVAGLVSDVAPDGSVRFQKGAPRAAWADGTVALEAHGLRWHVSDQVVSVSSAVGRLEFSRAGQRQSAKGKLDIDELHLLQGSHKVDATGIAARASVNFDDSPIAGPAQLALELSARSVLQDFAAYPLGEVALKLAAQRNALGVLRVTGLEFENAAGGTKVTLQGGLDLGFERRRLSVHGELEQDLARAWIEHGTFEGRGHVGLTFRVESSQPSVYRTRAALHLEDVHARLPRAQVSVESLYGEIPFAADVAVDGRHLTLLRGPEPNPFALHRFTDQHPLINRDSFLAATSITSPFASIAPLAGNLQVDQNFVSLSQLEIGLRGGKVTGECVLDWNGWNSTLRAHVRATGVLSSHGEPFDGNAAILVSASDRSIDGRIDILRIGSRHLLDLLDLHDPLHVDPAVNRIRHALTLGYPDNVRVQFDHGFASLHIAFGGLARFLSIDDLRGIPTGPLIDRVLARFSNLTD